MLLKYDMLRNIQLIKLTKRQSNDIILESILNNKLMFSVNGKLYDPLEVLENLTDEIMDPYKPKFTYMISGEVSVMGALKYMDILEVIDYNIIIIFIDSNKAKFKTDNSEVS